MYLLSSLSFSCVIQGIDSGECIPGDDFSERAPFCASTIRNAIGGITNYKVCVPREYKWYPNLTVTKKDPVPSKFETAASQTFIFELFLLVF